MARSRGVIISEAAQPALILAVTGEPDEVAIPLVTNHVVAQRDDLAHTIVPPHSSTGIAGEDSVLQDCGAATTEDAAPPSPANRAWRATKRGVVGYGGIGEDHCPTLIAEAGAGLLRTVLRHGGIGEDHCPTVEEAGTSPWC